MFSGLVEATAEVLAVAPEEGGIRIVLHRPELFVDISLGDSISIDGCCLTVVAWDASSLSFQAGEETLSKTTLGGLSKGSRANLERALALGDRLGGHLVTGHIDGLGVLQERVDRADWSDMRFECEPKLMRQMAAKGSVAVHGVSLTLVDVDCHCFSVALIPHTLAQTTLGSLSEGDSVNIETDVLAKYVQRQLETAVEKRIAGDV